MGFDLVIFYQEIESLHLASLFPCFLSLHEKLKKSLLNFQLTENLPKKSENRFTNCELNFIFAKPNRISFGKKSMFSTVLLNKILARNINPFNCL